MYFKYFTKISESNHVWLHIALYSYVMTDTPDSEQVCNISHIGTAKGGTKKYEDINSKSK